MPRKRSRKQQTRLTFDPVDPSSSPASRSEAKVRYELQTATRPKRLSANTAAEEGNDVSRTKTNTIEGSDKSKKSLVVEVPSGSRRPERTLANSSKQPAKNITIELSDSDSDDEIALPRQKSMQPKKLFSRQLPKKPIVSDNEEDEIGNVEADDPFISSAMRSQKPIYKKPALEASDDNDEDEDIRSSAPKRRRPLPQAGSTKGFADVRSPLKRSRSMVEEDEESDSVISPSKRRRRTPAKANFDTDEYDSLPDVANLMTPTKKNITQASPTSISTPGVGEPHSVRATRQRKQRRHRTPKEKSLELMKRKRAGEKIDELTESSESDEEDEQEVFQKLTEFEDDDEEPSPEIIKKIKRNVVVESENADTANSEDDFVIDGEDDPLGVQLPLQFSHASHKPMKLNFKDAVDWLVQNKINPAFPRNDPLFINAFLRLDDQCQGLAKSKFISTQWVPEFTRALYARPHMVYGPLQSGEGFSVDGRPKCDVCNHRSHKPSFAISFTGKPYDKDTLEPLENGSADSEDSDDSDSSNVTKDAEGISMPSEEMRWASGQVCKGNAEQSHALIHWKYALNEWVVGELHDQKELTPEKLAEREAMSLRKRTRYAMKLVDRWEEDGSIKKLYRDYKNQIEIAANMEAKGRGGWYGMG